MFALPLERALLLPYRSTLTSTSQSKSEKRKLSPRTLPLHAQSSQTPKNTKKVNFFAIGGAKRTMSVFFSLTHMSESFPKRVRMFQCNTCKEKLPIEQKCHGLMCKECKKAKSRNARAKKTEAKQDAKKARFVTAQDWWKFNENLTQTNSRYLPPKKEEFASIEAFEEAMVRHSQREVEGGLGRQSARQYRENENSVRREVYSEEGRASNDVNDFFSTRVTPRPAAPPAARGQHGGQPGSEGPGV